jgi:ribosome maturation factor RimP
LKGKKGSFKRPFFIGLRITGEAMEFSPRDPGSREPADLLFEALSPLAKGLGMSLIELSLFRHKGRGAQAGAVQVKITAYKPGIMGVNDCSKLHRALLPRMELEFPGAELYMEVSSPGIDRLIKDGSEFVHYLGRGVKCYCRDISEWKSGILKSADEKEIVLEGEKGIISIPYENIAKAKLDDGYLGS